MKESNTNYENLQRSYLELTELKHILEKTQAIMSEVCYPSHNITNELFSCRSLVIE